MNGSGYAVLLIDDDELGGGGLSRGDTVGVLCSKEIRLWAKGCRNWVNGGCWAKEWPRGSLERAEEEDDRGERDRKGRR